MAVAIVHRRYSERHADARAVLADPDHVEVIDPIAMTDAIEDLRHLLAPFRRHDQMDGLADGFLRGIAEQALRALVPRGDAAFQRLADDRIVGRGDDRRQERLRFNLAFEREVGGRQALLLIFEPPLRRAHRFAEDDHRDVREQVDHERDGFVEAEGRPDKSLAATEDVAGGEPPANGGEQSRAPAPVPHDERDRGEHRRQRECRAHPWRQCGADQNRRCNSDEARCRTWRWLKRCRHQKKRTGILLCPSLAVVPPSRSRSAD